LPKWNDGGWIVSIEGIDGVMHRDGEYDVPNALAGNLNPADKEWLRINLTVDGKGTDFSECIRANVLGIEDGLLQICVGSLVVIIRGKNVNCRRVIRKHGEALECKKCN